MIISQQIWYRKILPQHNKGKINIIKGKYDKLTANVILSGEELKAFFSNQEQGKDAHFSHLFNISGLFTHSI